MTSTYASSPHAGLVVLVKKARHLDGQHLFSRQKPYVLLRLDNIERASNPSKHRGVRRPTWNEQVFLPVQSEITTLKVSCFCKTGKRKITQEDHLLGCGTLDISSALKNGKQAAWIKLDHAGTRQGELFLELTYRPAIPPHTSHPPQNAVAPTPSVPAARFKRLHSELGSDETLKPPAPKRLTLDLPSLARARPSSWIQRGASLRLRDRFSFPSTPGTRAPSPDETAVGDDDDSDSDSKYVVLERPNPAYSVTSSPSTSIGTLNTPSLDCWSLWLTRPLRRVSSKAPVRAGAGAANDSVCAFSKIKSWNKPSKVHWRVPARAGP